MAKYRVLVNGRTFLCASCGAIYEGLNARKLVIACFDSHQAGPGKRPFIAYDRDGQLPGQGIEYPDGYGHFRRIGPGNPDYNRVQLGQARYYLSRHDDILFWLDNAIRHLERWPDKVTALQRLAYAFKMRRWESVKQAAYALAYSEAVKRRLDALNVPDIIRAELKLHGLLADVINSEDANDRAAGRRDIEKLASQLRLQIQIDDILGGADGD
ncbi:MAG: hypothetical protein A2Z29_04705 [Chloroflexi bacterium RBG_16_56_11]|nr:MAG: hypothetical protein A2Z29_04705 [Chloroflexi bacterium RBG_16_56_11]